MRYAPLAFGCGTPVAEIGRIHPEEITFDTVNTSGRWSG